MDFEISLKFSSHAHLNPPEENLKNLKGDDEDESQISTLTQIPPKHTLQYTVCTLSSAGLKLAEGQLKHPPET